MSHHLSGPRAIAESAADVTDLFAFPSAERPVRLVLVLNTFPFAPPWALFSDGLIYRFRLAAHRELPGDPVPFTGPEASSGRPHAPRLVLTLSEFSSEPPWPPMT